MQKFNSVDELVNTIRPVDPIYCIRPNSIKTACSWFRTNFPGKLLLNQAQASLIELGLMQ